MFEPFGGIVRVLPVLISLDGYVGGQGHDACLGIGSRPVDGLAYGNGYVIVVGGGQLLVGIWLPFS